METNMPSYAVAYIKTVRDADKFAAYRERAAEALARHGGRVASATRSPARLEGDLATPDVIAMLEFPTPEAAHAWHADPELAEVHDLRRGGLDITIFVTDAVS